MSCVAVRRCQYVCRWACTVWHCTCGVAVKVAAAVVTASSVMSMKRVGGGLGDFAVGWVAKFVRRKVLPVAEQAGCQQHPSQNNGVDCVCRYSGLVVCHSL